MIILILYKSLTQSKMKSITGFYILFPRGTKNAQEHPRYQP